MALDLIQIFKEQEYDDAVRLHENAEVLRKRFVEDYPLESIMELSLSDYVVSNKLSFCRRIQYELKDMASMGNARPDVFGIYLKGGITTALSRGYRNNYGSDFERAFIAIKKDIIKLLDDARNEDYDEIEKNRLNSLFKFRLIITYLPGSIVPVVAGSTLEQYCMRVGLPYQLEKKNIYRNIMLRNWKDSIPEISYWSNEVLMSFCDWLRRNDKKIDGNILKIELYNSKENAKNLALDIENLNLKGIDKEAVVKVRVNQGVFKDRLLFRYNRCCLCNVTQKDFLIASHIKPWKDSDENERLDIDNGLLLCPNHDKAFDRGYISFDDDGKILISDKLDETNKVLLNLRSDMSIKLTRGNKKYLDYHRNNYFN